ncbi:alkaline phosphatase D family protein [Sphingobium nicotianae]|uniref:Alkaline phosphatase D family protein n=1 Tax=Sphingobium nicotianae TaxID=2782607 RepID=A0A9X1DE49_9SPHN|nr:alkaline phosphatase D family protein [Sphingobium nicotianae]MBT2188318.1 alkaline phosphatase D family protein [Sphingobium nicotianae]
MRNSRRTFLATATAAAFTPLPLWAETNPEGTPRLLLGPMVGAVSQTSVPIWMQLSGDYFDAVVEYTADPVAGPWKRTPPQRARAQDNYTLVIRIEGLQPGTTYHYRVLSNGKQDKYLRDTPPQRVRTAPASPSRFRVAFGSCARIQNEAEQPIWRAIAKYEPDLFFWLGDNIYGDSTTPAALVSEYQRQRFVPAFQPIGRTVPQLAIWDDHDFGLDNSDRTNPIRAQALEVFRQFWANPSAGLPGTPGVFFDYSYGGVDFIFLDDRYHRAPDADEDTPQKEFLGKGQFEWLQQRLLASRAPFKVLACGSGWSRLKGPGGDSWAAYQHERTRLFDFIRDRKINGVVLLSGDTHYPYVACAPWSEQGGYDLYDLVSSALAQMLSDTREAAEQRIAQMLPDRLIRPPLLNVNNAGIIDFDMTGRVPMLTFNVIDIRGRALYNPVALRADELVNGVSSWKSKVGK